MAGGGGEGGGGGAVNKAVAAGLLGLQLLSLPFAVVSSSRHARAGVGLPDLQLVSTAAQAKAPKTLTLEEEMIRELSLLWLAAHTRLRCIMMQTHTHTQSVRMAGIVVHYVWHLFQKICACFFFVQIGGYER